MNRLQLELLRLYVPLAPGDQDESADERSLTDAGGRVRAMVLELAGPADWHAVSKVWNGVQADLDLPAPAIAVSGEDGYQLWFSLLEPLAASRAGAFLEALRVRYLGDVETHRISLMPAPDAASVPQARHARLPPYPRETVGHWSAFVAPDLAPMFADEPWLDMPPNDDGQARLLARLQGIQPADLQRALQRLQTAVATPPPADANPPADGPGGSPPRLAAAGLGPKEFLLGVMNDDTVALGLRIEAAKALLPGFGGAGRP